MGLGNPEIKRVRNVCHPTHLDQEGKKRLFKGHAGHWSDHIQLCIFLDLYIICTLHITACIIKFWQYQHISTKLWDPPKLWSVRVESQVAGRTYLQFWLQGSSCCWWLSSFICSRAVPLRNHHGASSTSCQICCKAPNFSNVGEFHKDDPHPCAFIDPNALIIGMT